MAFLNQFDLKCTLTLKRPTHVQLTRTPKPPKKGGTVTSTRWFSGIPQPIGTILISSDLLKKTEREAKANKEQRVATNTTSYACWCKPVMPGKFLYECYTRQTQKSGGKASRTSSTGRSSMTNAFGVVKNITNNNMESSDSQERRLVDTNVEYVAIGRQAPPKISLKRTPLEGMCPSRDPPPCVPASRRYRTHDGTCNNRKRPRWGSAQMPFHRFLAPEYADGVEGIRRSIHNAQLPSARFVSLVVHGTRQEEAPVTMMLALWGQLLDHDLTATAQPRSLNGSTPRCCGKSDDDLHPSCLPIKVPLDDPWLSPLGVRCLEFLRSAPAQRRDCLLSWREQTNQVTSYIDASPIYSSNPRTSDNARIFRSGLLLFGRGPPSEDVCFRAALANQCIRPGDARSGEQPGLLMLHMVWVNEHNQIATRLSDINPHWSDEKLYQETRRIVGAMFQHVTYREFLPVILGKEVSRLFNLELETSGFYKGYDPGVNPTVANEFSAAAFRFGHSLIQGSYMRADRHHRFILNNVTLHEETADGDLGGPGSLHRLVRGMVNQRALKRDEFITAELTNHLFQTRSFPFGLDLAAINIQRGRDHGIQPYVNWRIPCGLTPIKNWEDLDRVSGPASAHRLRKAYRSVDDIDLFVGGLAERPVVGGIVGPTFSCIIAQQFSNLRKGDRFWYENPGFESSFTPAQLESIRQVAFSQVLCRALGGGTLQPHVFLPADNGQNERLPCDSKLMAPIDLEPWTERDPFTRPNDSPNEPATGQSDNLIDLDALQAIVSSTTTTRRTPLPTKAANVINKVDFIPNGHTGLQIPSNGQIVLNSPRPQTTVVNNKLDLNLGTQPTPQNKPTTAIDNKLDLTTVPPKRKPTRKTTPKRRPTPSSNLVVNNLDFSLKRDSLDNTTADETVRHRRDVTFINLSKLFTREDNATLPKNNPALRRGYYPAPPDPPSDYDDVNNYDYGDGPVYVKPGYGYEPPATEPPPQNPYYYPATEEPPPQPPYCGYNCYQPPMTTYNPYGLDTRKPARTTPKRGQPSKIITPNNDYDPQKRRTTPRPQPPQQQQQQQQQQQHTTTQRTVIQRPGLVVINDVRPPTNNNNRPNDKPIFLSPSSSSSSPSASLNSFPQSSKNPSPSSASQSVFSVDPRPQFASSRPQPQPQSVPSPIFSQKKPNLKKPPKELRTDLPTRIDAKHDYDYDSLIPDGLTSNIDEHDGYLRPEQNAYEPLKKTPDLETYRNYSAFNNVDRRRQTAAPYEVPTGRVLWTDGHDLGRYAEAYQLHETDDRRDQFVGPYIDQTGHDTTTDSADQTTNVTERNDTEDDDDKVDETILTEDVEEDAISTKLDLTADFPDTHARTSHKDTIHALLDVDSDNANELPKLPRFDQPDSDDDVDATRPSSTTRRTTSRKRRPTRPKRPTNHATTNDRRQPGIALVPFVLLTSIERPDNWVMFNVAKSKKRNPLPEVPQLKSDVFSLSELPKPIAEED
ncbi:oxidase/peroxidase [Culex quinquefasciatus]|uniref:Oxidase/peroxidase n=1 Tax=Culex quinquefasciatus TaxID=7176 RepID=B0WMV9_CULQU|nr:oxidase/peroxidase [Culex quinquefasciatus]|eukprot:XP_001850043.1 oxidase/peroxidase [Culex quinquefasciatus]